MKLVEADASGTPRDTIVIWDRGFAANGFIKKLGDRYYAFGGEFIDRGEGEWEENDPRDGVHVLASESLSAVRRGAWMHPVHGYHRIGCCQHQVDKRHQFAFDGRHPGRIDARGGEDNIMMFDGKISAVQWHGRFLVYARANMKERGGRYVVVAKSRSESAWGIDAYEDFKLIEIDGYDARSNANGGNLYFAAVDLHPIEQDMLMALFPVNRGVPGEGNGDGESFIALSLSCDGIHWSRLTPLVWSVGREGRTYDHPVDGFLREPDGHVSFLVHRNVLGISPAAPHESQIVRYRIKPDALRTLSRRARDDLHSSCLPPSPAAPPPQSPPLPPRAPPHAPPPSPRPSPRPPSHSPHPLASPPMSPPLPRLPPPLGSPASPGLALSATYVGKAMEHQGVHGGAALGDLGAPSPLWLILALLSGLAAFCSCQRLVLTRYRRDSAEIAQRTRTGCRHHQRLHAHDDEESFDRREEALVHGPSHAERDGHEVQQRSAAHSWDSQGLGSTCSRTCFMGEDDLVHVRNHTSIAVAINAPGRASKTSTPVGLEMDG